jgi:hypothetical protein
MVKDHILKLGVVVLAAIVSMAPAAQAFAPMGTGASLTVVCASSCPMMAGQADCDKHMACCAHGQEGRQSSEALPVSEKRTVSFSDLTVHHSEAGRSPQNLSSDVPCSFTPGGETSSQEPLYKRLRDFRL